MSNNKFLLLAFLFALLYFQKTSAQDKIGDVKYSILEPDSFRKVHGPEWELMRGQSIEGSLLAKVTGSNTLPDARGVFIRVMNMDRRVDSGDAAGNRARGSYQSDTFKSHHHLPLNGKYFITEGTGGLLYGNGGGPVGIPNTTGNEGGDETRPRNITLYLYIKIN